MILKAGWSQWKKSLENSIHYWKNVYSSCSTNITKIIGLPPKKISSEIARQTQVQKHRWTKKNVDFPKGIGALHWALPVVSSQRFGNPFPPEHLLPHPAMVWRWFGVSCAKNAYDHIPSCHMNTWIVGFILWLRWSCGWQKHVGCNRMFPNISVLPSFLKMFDSIWFWHSNFDETPVHWFEFDGTCQKMLTVTLRENHAKS